MQSPIILLMQSYQKFLFSDNNILRIYFRISAYDMQVKVLAGKHTFTFFVNNNKLPMNTKLEKHKNA